MSARTDAARESGAGAETQVPAPLSRLDLLAAILPHCEPDRACLQDGRGRFGWLYSRGLVESAVRAWRSGNLPEQNYETRTKDGHVYMLRRPRRLGLVPHRDGEVRVFMIDLDRHDGGRDTTVLSEGLQRFFGRPAVVFRSKSGRGLHLFYFLAKPRSARDFVRWARSWVFNREGRPELFPKTHRLTQIWLPNEPDGTTGGDRYVSGDFGAATLDELAPQLPAKLPDSAVDFLMGLAQPGGRNDALNRAAFALAQRRCPEPKAEALCQRAAALCGLDAGETDATFRSGFDAGGRSSSMVPAGDRKTGGLPCIQTNCRQLRDVAADARAAVRRANTGPSVFLRHGSMAHIAWRDGLPVLEPMDQDLVYGLLARSADWMRENDAGDLVDAKPVRDVARDMLAYPDPDLPPLDAVVTAPVFGAGGDLLADPGYHAKDALWLHLPGASTPARSRRPRRRGMSKTRAGHSRVTPSPTSRSSRPQTSPTPSRRPCCLSSG